LCSRLGYRVRALDSYGDLYLFCLDQPYSDRGGTGDSVYRSGLDGSDGCHLAQAAAVLVYTYGSRAHDSRGCFCHGSLAAESEGSGQYRAAFCDPCSPDLIAYLVLGRKVGEYLPSITGTAYGAVVASLFWLIVQPPWSIPTSTWDLHTFWLIALVGIIGMALPFSLELAALHRLDATRAGIAAMFELPASAVVAFFWLGQSLDLWQILGCVLVLVGITIVQLEKPGQRASIDLID